MLPDNDNDVTADNSHAVQTEIANRDSSQPAVRYLWIPTIIYWGGIFLLVISAIRDIFLAWSQP